MSLSDFALGFFQTLAEIKAIWTLPEVKTHVNGVLSDGIKWRFFQLHKDGCLYSISKKFSHPQDSGTIVGLLRAFMRGEQPPAQDFDGKVEE